MAPIPARTTSIRKRSADTNSSSLVPSPLRPHSSAAATGSARPSSLAKPQTARSLNHDDEYTCICSLCHTEFHPPSYTLKPPLLHLNLSTSDDDDDDNDDDGGKYRIFCQRCYLWALSVGTCWRCRKTVTRGQRRVAFGWCFWHWGCYACLFCQVCLSWPLLMRGLERGWRALGTEVLE